MASTEEVEKMLRETRELSRDNHRILVKLERSAKWRKILAVLYWTLIIGSMVGAYYFIQPYVDAVAGSFVSIFGGGEADSAGQAGLFSSFFK